MFSKNLVYYHAHYLNGYYIDTKRDSLYTSELPDVAGFKNFKKFIKYFHGHAIIDRTNTLKIPFKNKNLYPIPKFDKNFNLSYEECCMNRMKELEILHNLTGKKFNLLYSGGIDSSGVLASFIEYFGLEKASKILTISCSKESMDENPWAWDRFIRKGKFNLVSSHNFVNLSYDDEIVITGEGNDQLFGGGYYTTLYSDNNLYQAVSVDKIAKNISRHDHWYNEDAFYCANKLLLQSQSSPFYLSNMYVFDWWVRFSLMWQEVNLRLLAYSKKNKLSQNILENGLQNFYNSENFQRWSMKFHYDHPDNFAEWKNYKLECKKMVLKFLKIFEYKNKKKQDSGSRIISLRPVALFIDEGYNLHKNTDCFDTFVEEDNSFLD